MNLGIIHQTCNQCGIMIYPHDSINTVGEKVKIEKIILPKLASSTTKAEHKTIRDAKITEVNIKEVEYKKNAKSVIRTETETEVTLEIERHLAVLEGNESSGKQKCPLCGFVLVSWSK